MTPRPSMPHSDTCLGPSVSSSEPANRVLPLVRERRHNGRRVDSLLLRFAFIPMKSIRLPSTGMALAVLAVLLLQGRPARSQDLHPGARGLATRAPAEVKVDG